jgi:hypothetical protein
VLFFSLTGAAAPAGVTLCVLLRAGTLAACGVALGVLTFVRVVAAGSVACRF